MAGTAACGPEGREMETLAKFPERNCRGCFYADEEKVDSGLACSHLQEGKPYKGKVTWTCGRSRFDGKDIPYPGHQWFVWSGIWKPNKTVDAAQFKCPFFEVFGQYIDVCRLSRPAKVSR